MNFLRRLFGKKVFAASNKKTGLGFSNHQFKFKKYRISGITPLSWEEMQDGRKYEVYRSETKAIALNFLKGIPSEKIPQLFYVIVETPHGNVGKDLKGIFDEP